MMSILKLLVVTSGILTTNKQLRTSSNHCQQATIYDGKVTVQPVQGRQTTYAAGTTRKYTPGASEATRETKGCFICKLQRGEGHLPSKCTKPKRKGMKHGSMIKCWWLKLKNVVKTLSEDDNAFLEIQGLPDIHTSQTPRLALMAKSLRIGSDALMRSIAPQCSYETEIQNLFMNHSTKQAIGFEKPFYLKKVRESKPMLYDGNTILKMDTIVVPDSDETLMLCEESRSKMILKEQDPMVAKHRVNTKPINYVVLNNDYYKRFVRQSDLYSEHAYWKATSVPALDPSHSSTTIKVEVPKELPKVSMVYTSLKELKRYLTGFDLVVKERTTATAITEGTWGLGKISDLNAKLQEQGLVIAALKNELRKLKGKALDKEATETHSVDPKVSKDNMEPITPKLLNKRTTHSLYIKNCPGRQLWSLGYSRTCKKRNYPQDLLLASAFWDTIVHSGFAFTHK
ncbi:hypothetical protein Tco_0690358 [Tanacetum coccineum]